MIRQTKKVTGKEEGAKIASIYLVRPYLNVEKKGMQNPKFLRHSNLKEMNGISKEADGLIKMVTIAPADMLKMKNIGQIKEGYTAYSVLLPVSAAVSL